MLIFDIKENESITDS